MSDRELDELQAKLAQPVVNEPERLPFYLDDSDIRQILGYSHPGQHRTGMGIYRYYIDALGLDPVGWDSKSLYTEVRWAKPYTMPLTISDAEMAVFKRECDYIKAPLKTLAVVVGVSRESGTPLGRKTEDGYITLNASVLMYNPKTAKTKERDSITCVFDDKLTQLYLNSPEAANPSQIIMKLLSKKMFGRSSAYYFTNLPDASISILDTRQRLEREREEYAQHRAKVDALTQRIVAAENDMKQHSSACPFGGPDWEFFAWCHEHDIYERAKRRAARARQELRALLAEGKSGR